MRVHEAPDHAQKLSTSTVRRWIVPLRDSNLMMLRPELREPQSEPDIDDDQQGDDPVEGHRHGAVAQVVLRASWIRFLLDEHGLMVSLTSSPTKFVQSMAVMPNRCA